MILLSIWFLTPVGINRRRQARSTCRPVSTRIHSTRTGRPASRSTSMASATASSRPLPQPPKPSTSTQRASASGTVSIAPSAKIAPPGSQSQAPRRIAETREGRGLSDSPSDAGARTSQGGNQRSGAPSPPAHRLGLSPVRISIGDRSSLGGTGPRVMVTPSMNSSISRSRRVTNPGSFFLSAYTQRRN